MNRALEPISRLYDTLVAMAPRAALVIGILVAGWLLAALARRVVRWLVQRSGLEAAAERAGVAKMLYGVGLKRGLAHVLGAVAYYCGLLFTLSAVAEVIALPGIAAGIAALIGFVPRLFAAAAVIVGGLLIGEVLRKLVRGITQRRSGDLDSPDLVSNILYYAVLTLATVMAIDQLGFETELIDAIIRIGVAGVLLAVVLAFGLGARTIFHNLLARQYYQPLIRAGDHIVVGDQAGTVVRYSRIAVVIRTESGECIIPCRMLMEQAVPLRRSAPLPDEQG